MTIRLTDDVLAAISAAQFDGASMQLVEHLDRKLYQQVAKVIEAAGGKWNRKAKAHLFEEDAAAAMDPVILTGEVTNRKQDLGQFDTPPHLVEVVMHAAAIKPKPVMKVLEPSAGNGALALAASLAGGIVYGYEIDPKRCAKLMQGAPFYPEGGLVCGDFLQQPAAPVFNVVVMNPPFARQADIDHVLHADRFLRPGGRCVAIMSAGVSFRRDRKTLTFRDWLSARAGIIVPLPADSFKASGTSVNTVLVTFGAASC